MNGRATIAPPLEDCTPRPMVSVVTATFNAAPALRMTLASVAGQRGPEIEHIVIDGGSSDETGDVLEDAPGQVRWLSEPDKGIADAMNKGVARARGHWIVVLHAGDIFATPEALAEALHFVTEEVDILACGILYGDRPAARTLFFPRPARRLTLKAIAHQGVLCRREVFERIGGFDTSYRVTMDYDFFLRARNEGCRIQACDMTLAIMDDGGVSSRTDRLALKERFAEERRVQFRNSRSGLERLGYTLYWPAYLAFRRVLRPLIRSRS